MRWLGVVYRRLPSEKEQEIKIAPLLDSFVYENECYELQDGVKIDNVWVKCLITLHLC